MLSCQTQHLLWGWGSVKGPGSVSGAVCRQETLSWNALTLSAASLPHFLNLAGTQRTCCLGSGLSVPFPFPSREWGGSAAALLPAVGSRPATPKWRASPARREVGSSRVGIGLQREVSATTPLTQQVHRCAVGSRDKGAISASAAALGPRPRSGSPLCALPGPPAGGTSGGFTKGGFIS